MTVQPLVHLVFKTHLDVGFTDFAANVVQTYFERFIPQAITLAGRTRDAELRFRWTTGAWLIFAYLEQASAQECRAMEQAIAAGDIQWHALPFTTHTELMDEALFRYGLSYSQRLDQRFGKTTIAAKMTDVPGHTRAMVPLLAEAGVRLLHIGVNPASSVPDVPSVFVWRDVDSNTDVTVIYDDTYGGVTQIAGLRDVLAVVLTGDNLGPPTDDEIRATYEGVLERVPGADVRASTLDDFARALQSVRDQLPIVTSEIGDTWIHGAGTDPTKVRQYRELSRLRREWLSRPLSDQTRRRIDRFSDSLIMIPEHTWGMDEKTHLADYTRYERAQLADLRQTEQGRKFEASWAEQRAYLDAALDALEGTPLADEARERLVAIEPKQSDVDHLARSTEMSLRNARLDVGFDAQTGAITRLNDRQTGRVWASETNVLARVWYQIFGQVEYDRYWSQYIRNADDEHVRGWALEDNTKPGMPLREGNAWFATAAEAYTDGDRRVVFVLAMPDESRQYGAPARLLLDYALSSDDPARLDITLSWFGKPANRLSEALWLSFMPIAPEQEGWRFEKLGRFVSPRDVVSKGARALHAIDQRIIYQEDKRALELVTVDAPLVAPGQPSLLDFHDQLPDLQGGVHVNLYNNIWGTNFPMWFEDDAVFRFRLKLT